VLAVVASGAVNLGLFLLAVKVLTAEPLRAREVAVGAGVYERLAQMQVRRPEEAITGSFTEAADEDPLVGRR
jgi:hypothetical protein